MTGFFKKGYKERQGICRYVNYSGVISEVFYLTDKIYKGHGYGRNIYPNGDYFIGYWRNYKRNGHGRFMRANGEIQEGTWKDEEFQDN